VGSGVDDYRSFNAVMENFFGHLKEEHFHRVHFP
jgi:hypothetical protein